MADRNYGRTNVKAMREETTGKRMEGEYVLTQGQKHLLRFLPPLQDGPFYFRYFTHYVGNEGVVCPQHTWRTRCPVCTVADQLFRSRDTGEVAQGRKLYRKFAYIAQVVDVRNPDDGVQLLRFGKQIRDQIISYFADPDDEQDEGIDITDPKTGATIRIEVVPPQGPNDFRKYVCALGKQGPVPYPKWLKGLRDLKELVKGMTKPPEELRALVSELDEDAPGAKEVDEDEDSQLPRSAKKDEDDVPDFQPLRRTAVAEEEDEAPPKKSRHPAVEDNDDDDLPAKSAKAAPKRQRFVEEEDED